MNAIPTKYNGVQFRSRLEARWAAFFDLCGWPWEYEPLDLDGYIPDFILTLHRAVLVEVKPIVRWPCGVKQCVDARCYHDAEITDAFEKVRSSGWVDEAVVVGATLQSEDWTGFPLTLGHFAIDQNLDETVRLLSVSSIGTACVAMWCSHCDRPSFCSAEWSWRCRVCGVYEGNETLDLKTHNGEAHRAFISAWREAGNLAQWKRAR